MRTERCCIGHKSSGHTWCVKARAQMWVWACVTAETHSLRHTAHSGAAQCPFWTPTTVWNKEPKSTAAAESGAAVGRLLCPGQMFHHDNSESSGSTVAAAQNWCLPLWSDPGQLLCTTSTPVQEQPLLLVQKQKILNQSRTLPTLFILAKLPFHKTSWSLDLSVDFVMEVQKFGSILWQIQKR